MTRKHFFVVTFSLFAFSMLAGCASHHAVLGKVLDRNGDPLERVVVGLEPGGVEVVTDENGAFMIDYLRDEAGERRKLLKRTNYTLSVFKPGFHDQAMEFYFKRGELPLEPISLTQDTIKVDPGEENLDPNLYPDRSQNNGAAYEGE